MAKNSVVRRPGDGDAFWLLNGLYEVKASGEETNGEMTVMEMTIPEGGGHRRTSTTEPRVSTSSRGRCATTSATRRSKAAPDRSSTSPRERWSDSSLRARSVW